MWWEVAIILVVGFVIGVVVMLKLETIDGELWFWQWRRASCLERECEWLAGQLAEHLSLSYPLKKPAYWRDRAREETQ